jgi:nicotinate dehydrogenase subunit A
MKMTLNVNGRPVAITADDPQMPLLYALRDDLGPHGPRFGCGLGQCAQVDLTAARSVVSCPG